MQDGALPTPDTALSRTYQPSDQRMKNLMQSASVDIKRTRERTRKYRLQDTIVPFDAFSAELAAIIPARIKHKIVGFEIHHHMRLTRLQPNHRLDRLRWVTLARGQVLRSALIQHLHARGWSVRPGQVRVNAVHSAHGQLVIGFIEAPEAPTEVTCDLTARIDTNPQPFWAVMTERPPWAKFAEKSTLLGFEYSRFHGVHFGASFTDIERFTVAFPAGFDVARVKNIARESGYKKTAQGSFRSETKHHKWSLKVSFDDNKNVILHGQHRWGHPTVNFKTR